MRPPQRLTRLAADSASPGRRREAIGTLLASGALTPLGVRFVQQMRDSLPTLTDPAGTGHRG